jgi:hypothetical protein
MLYCAVAFVVLIPVMYRHFVTQGLPKSVLFVVIPAYILLALGSYKTFKVLKRK